MAAFLNNRRSRDIHVRRAYIIKLIKINWLISVLLLVYLPKISYFSQLPILCLCVCVSQHWTDSEAKKRLLPPQMKTIYTTNHTLKNYIISAHHSFKSGTLKGSVDLPPLLLYRWLQPRCQKNLSRSYSRTGKPIRIYGHRNSCFFFRLSVIRRSVCIAADQVDN